MLLRSIALAASIGAAAARAPLDGHTLQTLEQAVDDAFQVPHIVVEHGQAPRPRPSPTPKPTSTPVTEEEEMEKPELTPEEKEEAEQKRMKWVMEEEAKLPHFFDHRSVWWGCGQTVHNQGQCGSCWANSAISVLNDRFCIHQGADDEPLEVSRYGAGAHNRAFQEAGSCDKANTLPHDHGCTKRTTILSPQRVVSCASMTVYPKTYNDSAGCNGGNAQDAWHFFHTHGVSTMSGDGKSGCTPYVSGACLLKDPHNNGCLICEATTECQDTGLQPKLYKVGDYGKIRDPGLGPFKTGQIPANRTALRNQIRMMKEEIMTNGPVQSCFAFPDNFQKFFNENPLGVYNTTEGIKISGSHCVTLTGWGRDTASGFDYWTIRNSWGAGFGTSGYYRWKMGDDLCGIEHEAWTGCPAGSLTCQLTAGVQIQNPDDQNIEEAVPWPVQMDGQRKKRDVSQQQQQQAANEAEEDEEKEVVDIAFGGKWMEHEPESDVAQEYAHHLVKAQAHRGQLHSSMVLSPGDYQVKTVMTKVTNGVVARVVMTLPGQNGDVEAVVTRGWDDSVSVSDVSESAL